MAIYRVWSGGDGTGGANNTDWAQAYATLAAALAVPPVAGDKIYISHVTQEESTPSTHTLPVSVDLISVNKDSSEAPTPMGTGGWIGSSDGGRQHIFYAGKYCHVYGVTLRNGGTGNNGISLSTTAVGVQALYEDCYAWLGTTGTAARVVLGSNFNDRATHVEYRNLTVRFSNASQSLAVRGAIFWDGGEVSAAGSSPTILFRTYGTGPGNSQYRLSGVDLTQVTTRLTLPSTVVSPEIIFSQCKLNASVTPFALSTSGTKAGPKIWIVDCSDDASPPARGIWAYYDGLGSLTRERTIYKTDGATGWAWKAVGSANASYATPFTTPWVQLDNTVNTAITPWFEIFREGSTTAYTDAQVWSEWGYKGTAGSDQATFTFGDRQSIAAYSAGTAGDPQATGSGTGDWETGSAADWSGKVDSGSAITAAEDGVLRGRVAVTGDITVYIDPQIRT